MTGVLPIGLQKATRVMPFVVHSIKEYICVMELHGEVPQSKLMESVALFRGKIYQRPPLKSNVKRVLRVRTVHEIEILEIKGRHVLLRISSDPGTYMRKLCHDIGIITGVGAHMRELRRVRTGPFREDHSITLHQLSEAVYLWKHEGDETLLREYVMPVEVAACSLPKIIIKDTAVSSVLHGSKLYPQAVLAYTEDVPNSKFASLFTAKGELVGVFKLLKSGVHWRQAFSAHVKDPLASPMVNVMERELYPKTWKRGLS